MDAEQARAHAAEVLSDVDAGVHGTTGQGSASFEAIGTGLGAAVSSFLFFASGALIPVLPFLFGVEGTAAVVLAAVLVGIALLATGVIVGLLSGAPPMRRALRQLMIGYGAAAITYLLGLLVGGGVG
jgi:VIT1/CCC1 family predicted Fe2+/Mn2+ transporter